MKYKHAVDQWFKVKANDTLDVKVARCIEGMGKFAGSLGALVVEGPTGVESEIGSFQLTNEQRHWIWEHRDVLTGQIAEVRALTVNESGAIRAGVFVRFHPSRSKLDCSCTQKAWLAETRRRPEEPSSGSKVLQVGRGSRENTARITVDARCSSSWTSIAQKVKWRALLKSRLRLSAPARRCPTAICDGAHGFAAHGRFPIPRGPARYNQQPPDCIASR